MIQRFKQINATPLMIPFVKAQLELLEAGYNREIPGSWDKPAIAYYEMEHIVSFIHYEYFGWNYSVAVLLGWTNPLYRNRGIYRQLWEELKALIREDFPEAKSITSGFNVNNEASALMHSGLARPITNYLTTYDL